MEKLLHLWKIFRWKNISEDMELASERVTCELFSCRRSVSTLKPGMRNENRNISLDRSCLRDLYFFLKAGQIAIENVSSRIKGNVCISGRFNMSTPPFLFFLPTHFMFRPLRAILRWDIQLDVSKHYSFYNGSPEDGPYGPKHVVSKKENKGRVDVLKLCCDWRHHKEPVG
jgi:hypothetical protein